MHSRSADACTSAFLADVKLVDEIVPCERRTPELKSELMMLAFGKSEGVNAEKSELVAIH